MKNIFRFLIGLVVFVFVVLLGLLISPLIIAGTLLFYIILGVVILIVVVVGIFVFIWYMSRKETKTGEDKDYYISQGKRV